MAHSPRTIRLIAASSIAVLMVAGSYAVSGPDPLFGLGRIAEAQSSEELLKEYAAKDSDTDGLPDWQEALYGTDPNDPESFRAGIKDGEAVAQGLVEPKVSVRPADAPTDIDSIPGTAAAPSSLTDRFAQTLLSQYLNNRGEAVPTTAEIVSFVENGVDSLSAESQSAAAFTLAQVRTSGGSGAAALVSYSAESEAAFAAHTVSADQSELAYFADALKDDPSALAKIGEVSAAYKNIADALMQVSVPAEARQSHLAIANALMHMSEASGDMASMETDPLRALMGIGLYSTYADELVAAFANLDGIYRARQVSIPEGSAGFYMTKAAHDAAAAR